MEFEHFFQNLGLMPVQRHNYFKYKGKSNENLKNVT